MDVEQHAWATGKLVREAGESAAELEEDLSREKEITLFFIPLADFDPSGAYWIGPGMCSLTLGVDGEVEWHFPPRDAAFVSFEDECRNAAETLHDYLVRLLSYALAHGMDVAKADKGGSAWSLLHVVPHEDVHTDTSFGN